jgi:hypothetical protein
VRAHREITVFAQPALADAEPVLFAALGRDAPRRLRR